MACADNSTTVYKLLGASEWLAAQQAGRYTGSADDARDGFIHFSAADQVAGTAAKYFRDRPDLVLVAVDTGRLGDALKWETSRGGALFPHLYGPLDVMAAVRVWPLSLGPDGVPVLPKDLA
jgi:uncharacterized protein (DUF952 family)